MNGKSKPSLEFEPGFFFVEYETEIIRQAFEVYRSIKRTAGLLDISARQVKQALKRAGVPVPPGRNPQGRNAKKNRRAESPGSTGGRATTEPAQVGESDVIPSPRGEELEGQGPGIGD